MTENITFQHSIAGVNIYGAKCCKTYSIGTFHKCYKKCNNYLITSRECPATGDKNENPKRRYDGIRVFRLEPYSVRSGNIV